MDGWLPAAAVARIDAGVAALRETFGERLEAAMLVGAAMNPARPDRAREPEVVAVVRGTLGRTELESLAAAARTPMGQGLRVRVLSRWDVERSADVFALELAEWRDRHHLLHGTDPFASLTIRDADLRRGLELALRGFQRRLRNRLLAALATDGRRDDVQRAAADLLERLVLLSHHVLGLLGVDVPREEPALLVAFAEALDQPPPDLALRELAQLRQGARIGDALGLFEAVAPLVRAATDRVDQLGG